MVSVIGMLLMNNMGLKLFLHNLLNLSFLDWSKLLMPWVISISVMALFVNLLEFESVEAFSVGTLTWVMNSFEALLLLFAFMLILIFGFGVKITTNYVQLWPIVVLWLAVYIFYQALKILYAHASMPENNSFFLNIFSFISDEENISAFLTDLLHLAILNIFIVLYALTVLHLFNYYETVCRVFEISFSESNQKEQILNSNSNYEEPLEPLNEVKELHRTLNEIKVASIIYMEVKSNFRTVYYEKNQIVKHWGGYGTLKEVEAQFPKKFLKISRSILVNPEKIEKIDKLKGRYFFKLNKIDSAFIASRSMNKTIKAMLHEKYEITD